MEFTCLGPRTGLNESDKARRRLAHRVSIPFPFPSYTSAQRMLGLMGADGAGPLLSSLESSSSPLVSWEIKRKKRSKQEYIHRRVIILS